MRRLGRKRWAVVTGLSLMVIASAACQFLQPKATPTPTEAPTPTRELLARREQLIVAADLASLYAGPSQLEEQVGTLTAGEQVTATATSGEFYLLELPSIPSPTGEVWISASDVEPAPPTETPTSTPSPTLTPTPTATPTPTVGAGAAGAGAGAGQGGGAGAPGGIDQTVAPALTLVAPYVPGDPGEVDQTVAPALTLVATFLPGLP